MRGTIGRSNKGGKGVSNCCAAATLHIHRTGWAGGWGSQSGSAINLPLLFCAPQSFYSPHAVQGAAGETGFISFSKCSPLRAIVGGKGPPLAFT